MQSNFIHETNDATIIKQEGLAVARIARDDGSSSTNVLQTGYALFSYALYTAFYTSAVTQYTYDVAPFWADVVISHTVFRHY